jgi:hypothetical protein
MPRVTKGPDPDNLAQEAWDLGDRIHAGTLTWDRGLEELAKRCPGYAPADYRQALDHGMFTSR